MKKFITLMLTVIFVLSCMIGFVFAAEIGETVTVSFTLAENPGFAVFGAQINYDTSALELIAIEQGSILGGGMFVSNPSNGKVSFVAMSGNVTATGVLFTATFKVKEGAAQGSYEVSVTLDNKSTANATYQPVALTIIGGRVEVATNHIWSNWSVVNSADCTKDGLQKRECTKCGETETEVIPALGHDYTWSFDEEVHWSKCARCAETVDSTKHDKEWVTVKNPTNNDYGLKREICTVCTWTGAEEVLPADPNLDPVPGIGDVTMTFILVFVAVMALCAVALFVFKRKMT